MTRVGLSSRRQAVVALVLLLPVDGGFVIGDRFLPRVRTYREDGSLEAAFGRFGDGPWEFRRIRSVAELADGRIVVTGAQSGALTRIPFEQLDVSVEASIAIRARSSLRTCELPEGSKVLGGGRYLYVLLSPRIPPWRIAR